MSELSKLSDAINALRDDIKRPSDSSSPASKTPKLFESLNGMLNKTSLALSGLFAVGLQGTVEGAKLAWAIKALAFQITNLFAGAIRLATNNLAGVGLAIRGAGNAYQKTKDLQQDAYVAPMKQMNQEQKQVDAAIKSGDIGKIGKVISNLTRYTDEFWKSKNAGRWASADNRSGATEGEKAMLAQRAASVKLLQAIEKTGRFPGTGTASQRDGDAKKSKDLQPTYTTSFNSLESLWQQMNKLATDTPSMDAAEATNSLLYKLYQWIVDHTPLATGEEQRAALTVKQG